MKKDTENKSRLKKQLVSGGVYIALSAVVVAVTVNTVVSLVSDRLSDVPVLPDEINTDIPEIEDFNFDTSFYDYTENLNVPDEKTQQDISVSDTVTGIDAQVTEVEQQPDILQILQPDTFVGFENFIKPCDGFVAKSQSLDIPVYSETLYDYRIHAGVDIACDRGDAVKACIGGVVSEVYEDRMLGTTVCITTKDGYTIKYANLSPELDASVCVGTVIETGSVIGGIGETALSEAAEAPHLHLEIIDSDGNFLDPEELIEF